MIIQSKYPILGHLEVPDDCRIEYSTNKDNFTTLEIYHTYKGKEYLLVREDCFVDGFKKIRPKRIWFNKKGNVHRDEKDGPAVIDPTHFNSKTFVKNDKKHCTFGPAYFTCSNEQLYFLEGTQLTKHVWEECVKNNNCKPPSKTKFELQTLKDKAAQLSSLVVSTGTFNGKVLDPKDLNEFKLATNSKSWAKYDEYKGLNSTIEVVLNCKPLDDTLRFYAKLNSNGSIKDCYLSVE